MGCDSVNTTIGRFKSIFKKIDSGGHPMIHPVLTHSVVLTYQLQTAVISKRLDLQIRGWSHSLRHQCSEIYSTCYSQ